MPPAVKSAPGDYLFALAIAAVVVGTSFLVKPSLTQWIVFGVGAGMAVTILLAALKPVRGPEEPRARSRR